MAISPVKLLIAVCVLLVSCYCRADIPVELSSAAAEQGSVFLEESVPSMVPTLAVTDMPSLTPTQVPSLVPSQVPSATPTTRAPTEVPTRAPTQAPLSLQFDSTMTIDNLSSLDLTQADIDSILSATAVSMDVDIDYLTYVGITAARRRLSVAANFKASAVSGLATVTATVPITSSTNTTLLYSTLTTNLNTGITSGTFTTTMAASGAPNTASAAVTQIPVYTEPEVVTPPDDGSDDDLSDGEIAGIVIGTVVGFALLCGIVYYVLLNHVMGSAETTPVRAQSKGSSFGSRQKREDVEIAL